jgi:hypothetical protein
MTKHAEGGGYVRVGFDSFYQNWPKSRECLIRTVRESKLKGKEYAKIPALCAKFATGYFDSMSQAVCSIRQPLHFGLLTAHQKRRQLFRTQTFFKTLKDVGEVDHVEYWEGWSLSSWTFGTATAPPHAPPTFYRLCLPVVLVDFSSFLISHISLAPSRYHTH